jgi:hypothetical protein
VVFLIKYNKKRTRAGIQIVMTNVSKKSYRLQILKRSVLESIQRHCECDLDENIDTILGTAEILHKQEFIGRTNYTVEHKVLSESFAGDYDTPPHGFESELILDRVGVSELHSTNGNPLPNITAALNNMLQTEQSEILNYL